MKKELDSANRPSHTINQLEIIIIPKKAKRTSLIPGRNMRRSSKSRIR